MSETAASETVVGERASDWSTYRRLLGYVKPHWLMFVVAVLGFQLGSLAEAYFVNTFGKLIDGWDVHKSDIKISETTIGCFDGEYIL